MSDPKRAKPSESPRLVINMTERARQALVRLTTRGANRTTVACRAIELFDIAMNVQDAGGRVVLVHADGKAEHLILL